MPAHYKIHWLPDGRTLGFVGLRGNYYEFSDSDHLDLHSVPVWCRSCGKITHGEDISTVEEIEKQIRDLQDPSSELYRTTRNGLLEQFLGKGAEYVQERLAELERRRHWRASRVSPPKCIHCGSADILQLPLGEPVPNPAGPGQLQIDIAGMCSTSFNEWFFTPEGDRIPRDTKPTYWYHPELDKPEHRKRLQEWLRSLPRAGDSATT